MIHLANFDADFKGRNFVDTSIGSPTQYACIGYGDNGSNGNPYFVGMTGTSTGVVVRTVLFKNALFVPATTQPAAT